MSRATSPGMRQVLPVLIACLLAPATAGAQETSKVQAGLLECRGDVAIAYGFGSHRRVRCEFRHAGWDKQYYVGTLDRAGLDFGVSDQGSMIWMVLATSDRLGPGALAGQYTGLSSGVALGPGFSANVLVAKDASQGLALQPLSISADSGISVSLAGATLTLQKSDPFKF